MSLLLLRAILNSDYDGVVKCIDEGADVNDALNSSPPMTMLDVAIETKKENPSSQSESELIINFLMLKGAKPYNKLINDKPKKRPNLPPLSVKGALRGNIKTTGIAVLPRRGGRTRRRTRKTRR